METKLMVKAQLNRIMRTMTALNMDQEGVQKCIKNITNNAKNSLKGLTYAEAEQLPDEMHKSVKRKVISGLLSELKITAVEAQMITLNMTNQRTSSALELNVEELDKLMCYNLLHYAYKRDMQQAKVM